MNYKNGKIYKIESHLGDKIYIGSTTKQYLSQRMVYHRSNHKNWKIGKYHYVSSFDVFDEYGIDNCQIILLENFPCSSRDELHSKEAHYIKSMPCVNKVIPNRSDKEYYQDNKEKIIENVKQYYKENVERITEYGYQYRKQNAERIREKKCEKFTCECGSPYTARNKAQHFRSQKHRHFIETTQ